MMPEDFLTTTLDDEEEEVELDYKDE